MNKCMGNNVFPGGVCLFSCDEKETIRSCNERMARYFGCESPDEFIRLSQGNFRHMVQTSSYTPLAELYRQTEGTKDGVAVHLYARDKKGQPLFLNGILTRTSDEEGTPVWSLYVVKGQTKESTSTRQILTGFMDSDAFYKKMLKMARYHADRGQYDAYVPVFLNLVNFKTYNAVHGWEAGNRLLEKLGVLIRQTFPCAIICHVGGDHFSLLADKDSVLEKLNILHEAVSRYVKDSSVELKAGLFVTRNDKTAEGYNFRDNLFDLAKVAADSIKKDSTRFYAEYNDMMGEKLVDRSYLMRHFEEALEKEYFQVYFQPQIRVCTGKVCGLEALSRWVDPERGMIMPGEYIPFLEETGLISRLDYYVIEKAIQRVVYHLHNGGEALPLSVNLSRVDFDNTNPLAVVEGLVQKYQCPRHMIHIEVTESALVHDQGHLRKGLRDFQQAGYTCWLDDFGSAYSSLNTLHTFHFDELKLDMGFMRHFNEESRKIARSIVIMGKTLGIHTLAEGVETKEQVDFLRAIGCEKIQGFYYGQPMPSEQYATWLEEKGLHEESAAEARLLDKAGLINLDVDTPAGLFLYDENHMDMFMENEACRKIRTSVGLPLHMEKGKSPGTTESRLLLTVKRALISGEREMVNFVQQGQYRQCQVRILGKMQNLALGKLEILNVSLDEDLTRADQMHGMMENVLALFPHMAYYSGIDNKMHILSTTRAAVAPGEVMTVRQWVETLPEVQSEDGSRLRKMTTPSYIHRKAVCTGSHILSGFFRMRRSDGQYGWYILEAIGVDSLLNGDILYCLAETPMEHALERNDFIPALAASFGFMVDKEKRKDSEAASVLDALCQSNAVKFFLKDEHRRFQYVSKGFLSYYGLTDEQDVLGKTDEDLCWHIDSQPFKAAEEHILETGIPCENMEGECIVHGVPRRILACKYPVFYRNGKKGIFGLFKDADREGGRQPEDVLGLTDSLTGLLSFRGMVQTGLSYYDNYRNHGEDFSAVLFQIVSYARLYRTMGGQAAKILLKKVADSLIAKLPSGGVLSYIKDGCFVFLIRGASVKQVQKEAEALIHVFHKTKVIGGYPVTLYVDYATARGSEARDIDGLYQLLQNRMDKKLQTATSHEKVQISLPQEAMESVPDAVCISDYSTHQVLYMNQAGLHFLGLPADYDYRGKLCYEMAFGRTTPCENCQCNDLNFNTFYVNIMHNAHIGADLLVRSILMHYEGHLAHMEIISNLSHFLAEDKGRNAYVFRESQVNDIIEEGLKESNPSLGIRKLMARAGNVLKADRIFIFEEKEDGSAVSTFAWSRDGVSPLPKVQVTSRQVKAVYSQYDSNGIVCLDKENLADEQRKDLPSIPGMQRFLSGHLLSGSRSMGFTAVINPENTDMNQAAPLLAILTRFIAIMLRNLDMLNNLEKASNTDSLTRYGNRRAFHEYLHRIPQDTPVVLIFGDMNGLKRINDEQGHEAGDQVLCLSARLLAARAGEDAVFRMGGDEFMVVIAPGSEEVLQQLLAQYRDDFERNHLSMAFGGGIYIRPLDNLDQILTEVDKRMYEDKKNSRERRLPETSETEHQEK